jgi:Xaa-Pro aminopeptidase
VTARAVVLLVDFRYLTAVEMLQASPAACPGLDVRQVPGSYDAALAECLESLGVRSGRVRERAHQRGPPRGVGACVPRARADARLRRHRPCRGTAAADQGRREIARLRAAAAGLTPVAEAAFAAVRPGVAEKEVAGVIEAALRAGGFERPAFDYDRGVWAEFRAAALSRRRANIE